MFRLRISLNSRNYFENMQISRIAKTTAQQKCTTWAEIDYSKCSSWYKPVFHLKERISWPRQYSQEELGGQLNWQQALEALLLHFCKNEDILVHSLVFSCDLVRHFVTCIMLFHSEQHSKTVFFFWPRISKKSGNHNTQECLQRISRVTMWS